MSENVENNLLLIGAGKPVDEINATFYSRFPYPQEALHFDYVEEPDFERRMLNQDVGDWSHKLVPQRPNIWVAGCGTNQAVFTALRFREGVILGSDVSEASLNICKTNASLLEINNLQLKQESINHVDYRDEFDYVVCTGVIHHNAAPKATLLRLANALKPGGILELMVYNRYHWILPAAFQQVVRLLAGTTRNLNFDSELIIAQRLMRSLPTNASLLLSTYLHELQGVPCAVFADALLQPVLYSFTIQSLMELVAECKLRLVMPCINQFDKASGAISWDLEFLDAELQSRYDGLSDAVRWQITNLLRLDKSPLLWFYLERVDHGLAPQSTSHVCDAFLDCVFERTHARKRVYERNGPESFRVSSKTIPHPPAPQDSGLIAILKSIDGETPMRAVLNKLKHPSSFQAINSLRIRTTTSSFPYLVAKSDS